IESPLFSLQDKVSAIRLSKYVFPPNSSHNIKLVWILTLGVQKPFKNITSEISLQPKDKSGSFTISRNEFAMSNRCIGPDETVRSPCLHRGCNGDIVGRRLAFIGYARRKLEGTAGNFESRVQARQIGTDLRLAGFAGDLI